MDDLSPKRIGIELPAATSGWILYRLEFASARSGAASSMMPFGIGVFSFPKTISFRLCRVRMKILKYKPLWLSPPQRGRLLLSRLLFGE